MWVLAGGAEISSKWLMTWLEVLLWGGVVVVWVSLQCAFVRSTDKWHTWLPFVLRAPFCSSNTSQPQHIKMPLSHTSHILHCQWQQLGWRGSLAALLFGGELQGNAPSRFCSWSHSFLSWRSLSHSQRLWGIVSLASRAGIQLPHFTLHWAASIHTMGTSSRASGA